MPPQAPQDPNQQPIPPLIPSAQPTITTLPTMPPAPDLQQPDMQPQPQYPYQPTPVSGTNSLAIVGLILAIIFPFAGVVVSIIALNQVKKRQQEGRGIAIAGLIISILLSIIPLALIIFTIMAGGPNKKFG